jgi:hypothetical protein
MLSQVVAKSTQSIIMFTQESFLFPDHPKPLHPRLLKRENQIHFLLTNTEIALTNGDMSFYTAAKDWPAEALP